MTITDTDVINAILGGSFDSTLDKIREAITERKDQKASNLRFELSIGDSVYFTSTCSPAYMRGKSAKVVKINRERVIVDLDSPAGRFHKNVTCPLSIITTKKP